MKASSSDLPEISYPEACKLLEDMRKYYVRLNPMDEAENFYRLTQHFKQEDVADALGISRGYIYKRLTLLELDSELQDLVRKNELAPNTGYELTRGGASMQERWLAAYRRKQEEQLKREEPEVEGE